MKPPMPRAPQLEVLRARRIAIQGAEPVWSELRGVPTKLLRASQISVSEDHVDELTHIPNLPPIKVVRFGRRYLIVDGHHRATVEIQSNAPFIQAWVLTPASPRRSETP